MWCLRFCLKVTQITNPPCQAWRCGDIREWPGPGSDRASPRDKGNTCVAVESFFLRDSGALVPLKPQTFENTFSLLETLTSFGCATACERRDITSPAHVTYSVGVLLLDNQQQWRITKLRLCFFQLRCSVCALFLQQIGFSSSQCVCLRWMCVLHRHQAPVHHSSGNSHPSREAQQNATTQNRLHRMSKHSALTAYHISQ